MKQTLAAAPNAAFWETAGITGGAHLQARTARAAASPADLDAGAAGSTAPQGRKISGVDKTDNQKPGGLVQRPLGVAMYLIATAAPELFLRCQQGAGIGVALVAVSDWNALAESIQRIKPRILLLDFELPGLRGIDSVVQLREASPETKIVVLGDAVPDETCLTLFKAGVRGCCERSLDSELFKRIFPSIEDGELWIRRSLTHRLLDALNGNAVEQIRPRRLFVEKLTERQQEIAALVGRGNSNKQIARALAITESTVKAHLTEIFRKTRIIDRLQLALLVVGNESAKSASKQSSPHFD